MKFECRPWGWMLTIFSAPGIWLKILRVRGRTSLQYHHTRSELQIGTGGIRFVPALQNHRVERGIWLELAWGSSVREGDIVRLDDDYGRS